MSMQPARGAISRPRGRGPVLGARLGPFGALFRSRSARNGTSVPAGPGRSPDSALIIARYRAEQDALGRQIVNVTRNIWDQMIDPTPFYESWPKVYPLLREVTLLHYRASAASAAKFYRAVSYYDSQGLPTVLTATANVPKLDRVADAVVNGAFYHQLNKLKLPAEQASEIARNSFSGAASRFALNGGRDTVIATALNDPSAMSWERLTEDGSCAYCIQQAARGPFKPGMTDFHPHDYDHCVAVPLFRGHQPANAELKTEWKQVTAGKTGKAARAEWEAHHATDTTNGDSSWTEQGEGTGSGATGHERRGTEVPNA